MQVSILNGVFTDQAADFRTSYPRNLVPVVQDSGISAGYLRPADGIVTFAAGHGIDRGGINWNGQCYRVQGTSFVRVNADGTTVVLGDVGPGGTVTMDYGFDRLGIASGGRLYYWATTLDRVEDVDLGEVVDFRWIAGYFACTDGTNIVVTELNDPTSVNPLKYGSAEQDPDAILAVDQLRGELYAFGRYTIQPFQNVGGSLFPFQAIQGAVVPRGVIGTHAYTPFLQTFAFVGSGRNEAPAVYLMTPGSTQKVSTQEIDQILGEFTEAQLGDCVMEARVDNDHQHLLIHLPDRCLVYDAKASALLQEAVWYSLTSSIVGNATYRARGLVYCYDKWLVGDPTGSAVGVMSDQVGTHYGDKVGWEFGTKMLYVAGNEGIVHEMELVCLTGRSMFGADPVIWTSYSHDGVTFSQERAKPVGRVGDRNKRIAWRTQGTIRHHRLQKFRGTTDARLTIARLEVQIETLGTRPRVS